jgi:hypothetical protein
VVSREHRAILWILRFRSEYKLFTCIFDTRLGMPGEPRGVSKWNGNSLPPIHSLGRIHSLHNKYIYIKKGLLEEIVTRGVHTVRRGHGRWCSIANVNSATHSTAFSVTSDAIPSFYLDSSLTIANSGRTGPDAQDCITNRLPNSQFPHSQLLHSQLPRSLPSIIS